MVRKIAIPELDHVKKRRFEPFWSAIFLIIFDIILSAEGNKFLEPSAAGVFRTLRGGHRQFLEPSASGPVTRRHISQTLRGGDNGFFEPSAAGIANFSNPPRRGPLQGGTFLEPSAAVIVGFSNPPRRA